MGKKLDLGHGLWEGLILSHFSHPAFTLQAETRAEFAERSVAKLEKTIDDLEETLASAKEENVEIHQTLDQTLLELNNL
ncbi:hypothetical protein P7K49_001343 [Saguinus oedipus]|uniref:Uncharacterized protein n=1 Tax=Saguinus oedipus TaxID=9490 RepID=A0ABQ9WE90_SAGOE|nr:hypothetical protein P7K49_001343 [Saguinus oedipus]